MSPSFNPNSRSSGRSSAPGGAPNDFNSWNGPEADDFSDDFAPLSDDFDELPDSFSSSDDEPVLNTGLRRRAGGRQPNRRHFAPLPDESADAPSPQPAPAESETSVRIKPTPKPTTEPTAAPVHPANRPAEIMDVDGGTSIFGQLKAKAVSLISGKQQENRDDFYTPPEGFVSNRVRYRMRNRRPLPVWLKSVALGAGLLFAIWVIVSLLFFGTMVGQVNYVDSNSHAPVRLTLDESAAMQAQLSEEITNDITLASLPARSNKNIQLILLAGVSNAIGSGDAGECDALILLAIDHEHDKIKLVSIARELYAQIPDYRNNMIGEAFFYDSANGNRALDILRQTVELNLCVNIDNIVSIDYDALQVIVNKLGGITLTVSDEEALYMSSHWKYGHFPRYNAGGLYTMTGAEMLNYLRMRYIGDNTDAQRTVRMRNVLHTIYASVGETPAIDRTAAIYSVLPYITTDMSPYQVYKIVSGAGRLADYDFVGYSLPINGSWGMDKVDINGNITEVVVANYSFNVEYLQKFIYDDDLTYTNGNATNGVTVPYISEEAKAAALAEQNAEQ